MTKEKGGITDSHSGLDPESQTVQLSADAIERLEVIKREGLCRIRIAARFDACHAEKDTIICHPDSSSCHPERSEGSPWRLPMLRQEGAEGRSLADFVAPGDYGFDSPAGMFAISVHRTSPLSATHAHTGPSSGSWSSEPKATEGVSGDSSPVIKPGQLQAAACNCPACSMDYDSLLDRSLRLTLAEAASGWLDAQLEQQLKDAQREGKQVPTTPVKIVKPAAGYASCPDHSLKRDILALLPDGDQLDIRLTESCAMIPDASICGLVFAHPAASYPEIRRLPAEALDAYAAARGFSPEDTRLFLSHLK